ncbi:hypothetical protein ACFY1A_17185 [Streptomyces sp. NPDC001520]|uniref:hypothetical protein n=1 Tax=Streptomyces sp. NPDC001520 TaxID=3364581 RepID=UPI00367E8D19
MTEYKAVCHVNDRDTVTATIDDAGVLVVSRHRGRYVSDVCLTLEKTREFARGLLALADEIDGGEATADDCAAHDVTAGDRVVIVREWQTGTGRDDGKSGTLVQMDPEDDNFPYQVQLDSDSRRTVWVHEVQRERAEEPADAPAPSVAPERMALLEEARKLVGSSDVGHLLAVARFLAGE